MRYENSRFRHLWRPFILGFVLALPLILLLVVIGYAGRHATWAATEFQLQNLDSVPAEFTAHFYDALGEEVFSFSDVISPGHTAYYRPEKMAPGLDPDFVGTLHVETDQQIAGAVMHFATTTPGLDGNDVFEMFADDITNTLYLAPYVKRPRSPGDFGSRILISNLGSQDAAVTIDIYDPAGDVPVKIIDTIPVNGSTVVNLADEIGLPPGFVGSAVIDAKQPIQVEIVGASNTQWAAYAPPSSGSTLWYAPLIPAHQPGLVTPTVNMQNVGAVTAQVTICAADGSSCQDDELPPAGSTRVAIAVPGPHIISSTSPIAVAVSVEGEGGSFAYPAGGEDQMGHHLAAPMLFDGYQSFVTTLWVYNTGAITTTVTITYVGTLTPVVRSEEISPDSVKDFGPILGVPHYSALVAADQPILALVEGANSNREDGRFTYWATPYVPLYVPPPPPVYLPLVMLNSALGQ